ncbi:MAG: response regulator transcription factor [Ignavibacteriae bacterium]|nr:response regulator transcription factor [Ignavibacteria bacterium]MBI3363583.1 response regulator transcription factor [Ignavibacteriota bacterium]
MPQTVRTLIVDDSALVRARLVVLLSRSPQIEVVGVAKTAAEAIDRAHRLKPNVVVLDIRLPGPSGLSIVRKLKRLDPPPTVIMLTNYSNLQIETKCREAGADFFFDKSSEFEKVIAIVKSAGNEGISDNYTFAG